MSTLLARFGISDDDRPWLAFVVKIVLIYGAWKVFQFVVDHTPALLSPWVRMTDWYAHKVATAANKILQAFGYDIVYHYFKAVYVVGTPGIMIEEHCLAIPATLIFGAFIAIYKGPLRHKLWYIPLGMIAVQGINLVRILGLALLLKHVPLRFFDFNHSYTALIMEYGMVFIMIMLWMRKYSDWEPPTSAAAKS